MKHSRQRQSEHKREFKDQNQTNPVGNVDNYVYDKGLFERLRSFAFYKILKFEAINCYHFYH